MIHLVNCHGEWVLFLTVLSYFPAFGPYLYLRFIHRSKGEESKE